MRGSWRPSETNTVPLSCVLYGNMCAYALCFGYECLNSGGVHAIVNGTTSCCVTESNMPPYASMMHTSNCERIQFFSKRQSKLFFFFFYMYPYLAFEQEAQ